eukprot:TRINITY_DN56850_c0_g1_i1.p1 TRINITY_DN56850_c0_g1~~TRINITY_DN56850_c0_g1_i1.p1  ORF type:complete len:154 (+),score=1.12 TRINITY_DN56850_c0_g1_i1:77-538(+)
MRVTKSDSLVIRRRAFRFVINIQAFKTICARTAFGVAVSTMLSFLVVFCTVLDLFRMEMRHTIYLSQSFVDSRRCLFLKSLDVPSGLMQIEVQRSGEALRIHITDYHDTISRANLVGVIRYVELGTRCGQVKHTIADLEGKYSAHVFSVSERA